MSSRQQEPPPSARSERSYWDATWSVDDIPSPVDPESTKPEDRYYRLLHRDFRALFASRPGRLVEVGCGGSRFLPYFARAFGVEVVGLDYSEVGCGLARAILAKAGVDGEVIKADMFDLPSRLSGQFDVVASFGLVEHFEDTALAIGACARLLRPGGTMITLIPNLAGLYGWLYRVIHPAVYKMHVPLTRAQLVAAHERAGLRVIASKHLLGFPGVIDVEGRTRAVKRSAMRGLAAAASRIIWRLEDRGLGIPPNRLTSPYIICYASTA
jgi:SAM-dependent methyltransferase